MLYYKKCVFKEIGKQMKYEYKKCAFSIVLLILYCKKCVFEVSGKLPLSLLNYFCNMTAVCSKQVWNFF